MSKALLKKLEKKDYRAAYVASHTRRWIAHQIRALREMPDRNWKQGDLAKAMSKPQSVVSRLEDPSYGKMTINTLLEVAKALDVALLVRFVDFKQFMTATQDVSVAAMNVPSYDPIQLLPVADKMVPRNVAAPTRYVVPEVINTGVFNFGPDYNVHDFFDAVGNVTGIVNWSGPVLQEHIQGAGGVIGIRPLNTQASVGRPIDLTRGAAEVPKTTIAPGLLRQYDMRVSS